MDRFKRYLTDSVLIEEKVITYRLLSRALRVHVNTAKQMLFEFHRSQNERRPQAVHATYLIFGRRGHESASSSEFQSQPQASEDGDVHMTGSDPDASYTEHVSTIEMCLVSEECLRDVLGEYKSVTSLHIYSVGPHPLKDPILLSDAARQTASLTLGQDMEGRLIYGGIRNPNVRRRERKGTSTDAAPSALAKTGPKPAGQGAGPLATVREEAEMAAKADSVSASTSVKKPTPLPKRGSSAGSGIMAAFSKAAAKMPKAKSKPATPSVQPMSDDGEDDADIPVQNACARSSLIARQQKEDKLRKMMEEDDDDESPEEKEATPEEQAIEEPSVAEKAATEEAAEVVSASADGRRRGKRRVMKKKQIMDDQGYLVTIQDSGWESFSEDEAPPPKPKPKAAPAPKSKKGVSKGGSQGSIMSFFSKK